MDRSQIVWFFIVARSHALWVLQYEYEFFQSIIQVYPLQFEVATFEPIGWWVPAMLDRSGIDLETTCRNAASLGIWIENIFGIMAIDGKKRASAKCLRIKQIQAAACRVQSRKLPSSFVMARTTRVGSIHCLRPQNRLSSNTGPPALWKALWDAATNFGPARTVKNLTNLNQWLATSWLGTPT